MLPTNRDSVNRSCNLLLPIITSNSASVWISLTAMSSIVISLLRPLGIAHLLPSLKKLLSVSAASALSFSYWTPGSSKTVLFGTTSITSKTPFTSLTDAKL